MKKTTVRMRIFEDRVPVSGWQTDVPGLVAAKFNPGTKKVHERWMLFHEESGGHIATLPKLEECNHLAREIADACDWTEPASELKQHADEVIARLRAAREWAPRQETVHHDN